MPDTAAKTSPLRQGLSLGLVVGQLGFDRSCLFPKIACLRSSPGSSRADGGMT